MKTKSLMYSLLTIPFLAGCDPSAMQTTTTTTTLPPKIIQTSEYAKNNFDYVITNMCMANRNASAVRGKLRAARECGLIIDRERSAKYLDAAMFYATKIKGDDAIILLNDSIETYIPGKNAEDLMRDYTNRANSVIGNQEYSPEVQQAFIEGAKQLEAKTGISIKLNTLPSAEKPVEVKKDTSRNKRIDDLEERVLSIEKTLQRMREAMGDKK